jgi:hypothetical protein
MTLTILPIPVPTIPPAIISQKWWYKNTKHSYYVAFSIQSVTYLQVQGLAFIVVQVPFLAQSFSPQVIPLLRVLQLLLGHPMAPLPLPLVLPPVPLSPESQAIILS